MTGAPDLPSALERFTEIAALLDGRRPALFLDYDGTLTPIVERPEDARMSEAMRDVLRRLAERWPTAVVSGRGRDDVAALVGLPDLVYAGSHGFDISGPEGALRHEVAAHAEPRIAEVTRELERELAEVPGAQVEPKRFTVAVHYRRVAEEDVARVEAVVDRLLDRGEGNPAGLRKSGGKKVWEVRPDMDWDKGRAVEWLLEALELDRPDVLPLYVGDDLTDEDAFRALAGRGIGVVVTEEPRDTAARYRLRDTGEVRRFLELLAAWEGHEPDR